MSPDGGIGRRARFRCEWITSLEVQVFFRAFFVFYMHTCVLQANISGISADVVSFSYKNKTCTLRGNVHIADNTKKIDADDVTITFINHSYSNIKNIKQLKANNVTITFIDQATADNKKELKANKMTITFADKNYPNIKSACAIGDIIFRENNVTIQAKKCTTNMTYIVFYDVIITYPTIGTVYGKTAQYNISQKQITISPRVQIVVKHGAKQ